MLNTAEFVKQLIRFFYSFSPYFWLDSYYKRQEGEFVAESEAWQEIRDKRLFLSEFYIVGWLGLSVVMTMTTVLLPSMNWPQWVMLLMMLRIFGIVNKELGVILFGICKITEGSMLSATGRVIVLAMVNFLTAMFLFASLYQMNGVFNDVPNYLLNSWPVAGLVHSLNVQFTMSGAFTPDNVFTWWLTTAQGMFCFVFGTIVISLFVSLLNVKPLRA